MKKLIKWLVRLAAVLVVVVFVVVLGAVGLSMTEWFVKSIVLPMVSDKTPYNISLTHWRFRPWSSLAFQGLVVRQKDIPAGRDNTIAEVRAFVARYTLASFLRKHPVLDSIEIDAPVIGLTSVRAQAGPGQSAPGAAPAPAPVARPATTSASRPAPAHAKKTGKPRGMDALNALALPFTAKSVRISDAEFSYQDDAGLRVHVRNMNLHAHDLGPAQHGTIECAGTFSYADGKDVTIERLPLTFSAACTLNDSIMPKALVTSLAISNVLGHVGKMDLRSLATTVQLSIQSPDARQFTIKRAVAQVDWLDHALAHVLVTGSFNAQQITADGMINAAVRPSPLWQIFVPEKSGINISKTKADVNVMIKAAAQGQTLTTKGSFNVQNLTLLPPKAAAQEIAPLSFIGAFDASLDQRDKTFVLPQLTVNVAQHGAQVVAMRTASPVSLSWAPAGAGARGRGESAQVRLDITKLSLPQFSAFLGNDQTSINDGELSANLVCDIANRGERIGVQGALTADNIELRSGKATWRKLTIKSQIATELEALTLFNVRKLSAETLLDKRPVGTVAAGGYYDRRAGSNHLALAVAKMSSELVRPLLDPQNKNRRLDGLVMTLQALTENSTPQHTPQDVGIKMTIDNPGRRSAAEWDTLAWDVNATVSPKEAVINTCTVRVSPAAWPDNQLALKGTIQLNPGTTPSQLELRSKQFDATVLLDTFMPAKKSAGSAARYRNRLPWDLATLSAAASAHDAVPAPPVARASAAGEPAAIDLQGRDLELAVRCDKLRARELLLRPLHLDFAVKDSIATLVSRDVLLNNGEVRLRASANLAVPGFTYTASAFATNVPLRPLINSFVPEQRNKVDGQLAANLSLRGAGVTKPSLKKTLQAQALATVDNGTLLNPIILGEIGRSFHIPNMQSINMADIVAPVTVENGLVRLNDARISSSRSFHATMRGTLDFEQRLDMLVFLGLSGAEIVNLCSTFGVKMPLTKNVNQIYNLPVPIPVRGTLSKPKVEATYSQFLAEVVKAVGLDPAGVLRGVLDFIPKGQSPKVDQGLKMLEGLFKK